MQSLPARKSRKTALRRYVTALCYTVLLATPLVSVPAMAETVCVSTVTRYYLFGVEVWRRESMKCTDIPSLA